MNKVRLLSRGVRDLGLLAVVLLLSSALMQLRWADRRIELFRGTVLYDRHCSFDESMRLAQALRDAGAFDGRPRAVRLACPDGHYELSLVVDPHFLNSSGTRDTLERAVRAISRKTFENRPVTVRLADPHLRVIE